jgi:transcriptional regulator with XRE-family HTH domain
MTTRTRRPAGTVDAVSFLEKLDGPLTFGGFVNAIRDGEGWTLEQMAAKLGVSAQHVCDIEKGRRSVGASRAARWARELGYDEAQMVQLALQAELQREGVAMTVEVRPGLVRLKRAEVAPYRAKKPRR